MGMLDAINVYVFFGLYIFSDCECEPVIIPSPVRGLIRVDIFIGLKACSLDDGNSFTYTEDPCHQGLPYGPIRII